MAPHPDVTAVKDSINECWGKFLLLGRERPEDKCQEEISELQAELDRLDAEAGERAALLRQLDGLAKKVASARLAGRRGAQELRSATARLVWDHVSADSSLLKDVLEELGPEWQAKIDEAHKDAAEQLEAELAALEEQLRNERLERNSLEEAKRELLAKLIGRDDAMARVEEDLDSERLEREHLAKVLEDAAAKHQAERAEDRAELRSLADAKEKLAVDKTKAEAELERERLKLGSLDEARAKLQSELAKERAERKSLDEAGRELQAALDRLTEAKKRVEAELASERRTLAEDREADGQAVNRLRAQLAKERQERQSLEEARVADEEAIKRLRLDLAKARRERQSLEEAGEAAVEAKAADERAMDRLRQDLERARRERRELEDAGDAAVQALKSDMAKERLARRSLAEDKDRAAEELDKARQDLGKAAHGAEQQRRLHEDAERALERTIASLEAALRGERREGQILKQARETERCAAKGLQAVADKRLRLIEGLEKDKAEAADKLWAMEEDRQAHRHATDRLKAVADNRRCLIRDLETVVEDGKRDRAELQERLDRELRARAGEHEAAQALEADLQRRLAEGRRLRAEEHEAARGAQAELRGRLERECRDRAREREAADVRLGHKARRIDGLLRLVDALADADVAEPDWESLAPMLVPHAGQRLRGPRADAGTRRPWTWLEPWGRRDEADDDVGHVWRRVRGRAAAQACADLLVRLRRRLWEASEDDMFDAATRAQAVHLALRTSAELDAPIWICLRVVILEAVRGAEHMDLPLALPLMQITMAITRWLGDGSSFVQDVWGQLSVDEEECLLLRRILEGWDGPFCEGLPHAAPVGDEAAVFLVPDARAFLWVGFAGELRWVRLARLSLGWPLRLVAPRAGEDIVIRRPSTSIYIALAEMGYCRRSDGGDGGDDNGDGDNGDGDNGDGASKKSSSLDTDANVSIACSSSSEA